MFPSVMQGPLTPWQPNEGAGVHIHTLHTHAHTPDAQPEWVPHTRESSGSATNHAKPTQDDR